MKKLVHFSLLIVTVVAMIAIGTREAKPSPEAAKLPELISIGVAAEGSTTYMIGVTFADVLKRNTPIRKVIALPTGGTPRWLALMKDKRVEFGIDGAGGVGTRDAYYGIGPIYESKGPHPVNWLISGHTAVQGCCSIDPSIKTIYDLKGKRLYFSITGHTQMGRHIPAVIEAAGISGQVKMLTFPNIAEAARGLAEGKADAVFYVPFVAPLLELHRTKGLSAVAVPMEVLKKAKDKEPTITYGIWKKGEGFATQDTPSLTLSSSLVVREDLDVEAAYTVVKTILENYDEYKDTSIRAKQWTLENATSVHIIPYHPGAIKYYREKGVWTDAMERRNQELIAARR